jgi:hypothetical protein
MQMLALYELGIIEHLQNRYRNLNKNQSKLGKLLSGILQVYDKEGIGTIRKYIKDVSKAIGEKSALQNDDTNEDLRIELLKVDIKAEKIN